MAFNVNAFFRHLANIRKKASPAPEPPPAVRVVTIRIFAADGTTPVDQAAVTINWEDDAHVLHAPSDAFGRAFFTVAAGANCALQVSADRYVDFPHTGIGLTTDFTVKLAAAGPAAREGVPSASGRSWSDAGGKFLSFGTSLFWALWGHEFDRARLEQHFAWMRDHDVDDGRVLLVLPDAGLWAQRRLDPFSARFLPAIGELIDLAYDTYGRRLAVAIFGEGTGLDPAQRAQLTDAIGGVLAPRAHKLTHVEIANEAAHTGFPGEDGKRQLWALAAKVRAAVPNLVALSSAEDYPANGDQQSPEWLYDGSPATVFEFHGDRNTSGDGGLYRPCRQPYGYRGYRLPVVGSQGEPWGPHSSLSETSDPTILAATMLMTYLCGWGRFVLHTGEGVFGMAHQPGHEERAANVWEAPNIEAVATALAALRRALPADLADWNRLTHANPSKQADWPFVTEAGKQWDAAYNDRGTRAYAAWNGARFLAVALKVETPIDVIAKQNTTFRVRSVTTWDVLDTVTLPSGAHYVLQPTASALVLEGEVQ